MREPEVYDVWLMRVEFPDHPGVGKVRPVIVTRVESNRVSGIVVKVTSVMTWNGPCDVPLFDCARRVCTSRPWRGACSVSGLAMVTCWSISAGCRCVTRIILMPV